MSIEGPVEATDQRADLPDAERVEVAAAATPSVQPSPGLHLEVLDRRQRVQARTRIDELPCTIGRSYACGVILDDPFVSPMHVRVYRGVYGEIVVEDLGSTNGIHDLSTGRSVARIVVTPGTTLRVGQSLLRFHTADEPVVPAVPMPGVFSTPGWAILPAFAIAFGACSLSWYLGTFTKLTVNPFVWGAIFLATGIFTWAGAWALLSRLLQHQSHFAEHCIIACSYVPVFVFSGWLTDYYAFSFGADRSAAMLEWLVPTALTAALLYSHLRFCSLLPSRQLMMRAGGFAVVATGLVALLALTESLDPEWTPALTFRGELKPPIFRLVSSDDLDEFFSRVEALKAKVDADSTKN